MPRTPFADFESAIEQLYQDLEHARMEVGGEIGYRHSKMNVSDIVATDCVELSPGAPASKRRARFEAPSVEGAVVTADGEFEGVVRGDDLSYSEVADVVENLAGNHDSVELLDAKIHLDEHQERRRGTPLIFARIRLSKKHPSEEYREKRFGW